MRANYYVPSDVEGFIIQELYAYWKNIEYLRKYKEKRSDVIDSSPSFDVTGIKSKYQISKPTENKAIKLSEEMSTRAYIMACQRLDLIKNAFQYLNKEDLEVVEYIFRDKCSQIRAEIEHNISKDVYYNVRSKIIYLTAVEYGKI